MENIKGLNLYKKFGTDKALEQSGVHIKFLLDEITQESVTFICKRYGGHNSQDVRAILSQLSKPHINKLTTGTLSKEEDLEIAVRTFVKSSVIGWENVCVDGKPLEFTEDNCVSIFKSFPDLYSEVLKQASEMSNFKELEQVGNS